MSSVTSTSLASSSSSSTNNTDLYKTLDPNDFLKMLLTELQNQDPLNPMDDTEILQQVSQIKAIESNQKLTDTLTSMSLWQNVSAANSLLQKTVTGLTDAGASISGKVDSVSISDAGVKVNVGDQSVSLKNITKIT
jgi:flagellar basal-body rod modification protein FlgD